MGMNSNPEKREYPRHSTNQKKFLTVKGQKIHVLDVSWGGICFLFPEACEEGTIVQVEQAEENISMPALVVECFQPPQSTMNQGNPFQIRCQFEEPPGHPEIEELIDFVRS